MEGDPGEIVTLVGFRDVFGPAGETTEVRPIVPLNPFSLLRVIVEVPDEPCLIATEDGLGTIEKPGWRTTKVPTIVV